MAFSSPEDIDRLRDQKLYEDSLRNERAYTQRQLETRAPSPYGRGLPLSYHSTHHEAVEQIVRELRAAGWDVVDVHITPGYYSHHITIRRRGS